VIFSVVRAPADVAEVAAGRSHANSPKIPAYLAFSGVLRCLTVDIGRGAVVAEVERGHRRSLRALCR
jgi:hypothetical protein